MSSVAWFTVRALLAAMVMVAVLIPWVGDPMVPLSDPVLTEPLMSRATALPSSGDRLLMTSGPVAEPSEPPSLTTMVPALSVVPA